MPQYYAIAIHYVILCGLLQESYIWSVARKCEAAVFGLQSSGYFCLSYDLWVYRGTNN